MGNRIYLDYNSTTPVDRRVVEAMLPPFPAKLCNPLSENHDPGRAALEVPLIQISAPTRPS